MRQSAKTIWSTAGILIAVLVVIALTLPPAFRAEQERREAELAELRRTGKFIPHDELENLCPPDRIIEFKIGANSYYLPWKLIRNQFDPSKAVWVSTGGSACPDGPVQTRGLWFRPFMSEIARERDLNLMFLAFGMRNENERRLAIADNPASRVTYPDGSYIEDATKEWRAVMRPTHCLQNDKLCRLRELDRVYRLQQASAADGTWEAPVLIDCGDIDPHQKNRLCRAVYFQHGDLAGSYKFWPKGGSRIVDDSNQRLHLPDGPAEPDGFLAFDARIRKWIDDLQKRPSM